MSTIQDFKNAPVGATATHPDGIREVIRQGEEPDGFPWVCTTYGELFCNEELAEGGYTLEHPVPTTAREALDLAWNLAHPVKEGQFIPEGVRYVRRSQDGGLVTLTAAGDWTPDPRHRDGVRTLDPLPDPKPGWVNAPAVVAFVKGWVSCADPQVFERGNETGTQWVRDTKVYHWYELVGVVPLYPEGEKE